MILLEGSPVVFASFLALLHLHLPQASDLNSCLMDGEPVELVTVFRQNVLRGVLEDPEQLLQQVREFIPKMPQATINDLRFEITGKKR